MICLCSTISSSKSIFGIVVIPFPSFSSHCPCWTSASLAAAFFGTVFLLILRRRPLVCSACRWLCSSACCWLCSSRFFSSLLQIFVFFSLSSYPCCFTSFFSSFHHWLVGCGPVPDSHHLLLGCGSVSSSESLCGRLRLRHSLLASSNITTQCCAFRD